MSYIKNVVYFTYQLLILLRMKFVAVEMMMAAPHSMTTTIDFFTMGNAL